MTVRELREFLSAYPDDMEVLETRMSDLGPMSIDAWGTIEGIQKVSGAFGWVQRARQMMDENRARVRTYLHYAGH